MAFPFLLKLTKEQEAQCARFVGWCRFVWNRALAMKKEACEREGKSVSRFKLDALLVQWKKEFPWLAEAPSQALQQVN